jgi:hypothetical protein
LRYSEQRREQRIRNHISQRKQGAITVGKISKRDIFVLGLGLYWGEGYKGSNGEMGFTNSNPEMILFYLRWLYLLNIHKEDLIFRLSINKIFKKQEKEMINFWVKYLRIYQSQFSKTTLIKSKLRKLDYGNIAKYKGTLRVKVRKGLALKNKILGAIECIAKNSKI